jgi:hypothetical protein
MSHNSSLKLFGPDHGDEQVDEQQQGDDSNDEIPHNLPFKAFRKSAHTGQRRQKTQSSRR